VPIDFGISDVRNQSDLSDYAGELQAAHTLRITDTFNGATLDQPGTAQDVPFAFTVPCSGTPDTTIGSECSIQTTANSVVPGLVVEGHRTSWQLSQMQVMDGGPDGDVDTADNTLFARQGIFAP